jgi:DNA-binding NarL/FixJ family response regulator
LLFKESVGFEESEHWKTSILIPLLPNFLAVLTTRNEVKESPNVLDYFNSLRAVLQLFLMTKSRSVQLLGYDRKRETNELVGSKLTERQDLILTLIQQGLTNVIIAQRLGYSESLIRQETIAIYKKLRVNGRRDLYNTEND